MNWGGHRGWNKATAYIMCIFEYKGLQSNIGTNYRSKEV
jgi:hypothetical protein